MFRPCSITSGTDIFPLSRNMGEDLEHIRAGAAEDVITKGRLDCAVPRILALKAVLKLHKRVESPSLEHALSALGCQEHRDWAREIAREDITLVKEESGVLPLNPQKKRVLYCHRVLGFWNTGSRTICAPTFRIPASIR